jgi:ribosome maturation factor RimP
MYTDILQLEEELDEFLYDFGFQAVNLQIATHNRNKLFRLFVDRVDGNPVTIADCSAVARQVELFLEMKELYNDNTSLELSSAGVDRLLKRNRDFERYLGEEVKVIYSEEGQKRTLVGELSSFSDDVLVILPEQSEGSTTLSISRGTIEKVNLVPKLSI